MQMIYYFFSLLTIGFSHDDPIEGASFSEFFKPRFIAWYGEIYNDTVFVLTDIFVKYRFVYH